MINKKQSDKPKVYRIKIFGIGITYYNINFPVLTIDWFKGNTWYEYYLIGKKANPFYKAKKK